jgi:hypothetical protein
MVSGIVNTFIQWYVKKRVKQMEVFINNPEDTQNAVLSALLLRAKDTEYGKISLSKYLHIKTLKIKFLLYIMKILNHI